MAGEPTGHWVNGHTWVSNMDVHYSSKTDLWETPADLFETIKADYNPTLDVCAIPENAKCDRYFTPEQDGLSQEWEGVCWMNPPYGRAIGKWVKKAYEASQRGATVVCLLPARTDTAWWHDYVMRGRIKFLRGRLKFGGGKNSAPFPSAIVVFDPYITALNVASDMQEDELADIRYMIEGVFVA